MATSLAEISQMLGEEGINYQRSQDFITMKWETEEYRNTDGEASLLIAVMLSEEGEYVSVFLPTHLF